MQVLGGKDNSRSTRVPLQVFQTLTPSKQGLMAAQGGRLFKFEKPTIVGKLFVIGWVSFQNKMAKLWHHDVAGSPFQHQK